LAGAGVPVMPAQVRPDRGVLIGMALIVGAVEDEGPSGGWAYRSRAWMVANRAPTESASSVASGAPTGAEFRSGLPKGWTFRDHCWERQGLVDQRAAMTGDGTLGWPWWADESTKLRCGVKGA